MKLQITLCLMVALYAVSSLAQSIPKLNVIKQIKLEEAYGCGMSYKKSTAFVSQESVD